MIRSPFRRHRTGPQLPPEGGQPAHRLIRDAVEAEEIAVEWLCWRGFTDARCAGSEQALGIQGSRVVADVSFDPLPMEGHVLERLVARAAVPASGVVSFTFAGWTPEAFAWAERHDVPLVRFTFAGNLEPSNEPARRLRTR